MSRKNVKTSFFYSVIIATFNCANYILEALESVWVQSFRDYEVIIVDDCSKDQTLELIKNYIQNKDNWHLVVNEKNMGTGSARNKAIRHACGQYVAILDGDDIWEKDKLLRQSQFLLQEGVDFCYASYCFVDKSSKDLGYCYPAKPTATYKSMLKENYIGCSTAVVSRKIFNSIKMKEREINEDYIFWLEIMRRGYKGAGVLEPLAKYRIHHGNRSFNKIKSARSRFMIYRKYEKLSLLSSIYYILHYAIHAIIRSYRIRRSGSKSVSCG